MPCIAGNFGPAGLVTQVGIFRDRQHVAQFGAPAPGDVPQTLAFYNALFDTGASATCISPRIVKDVGLTPIGKVNMISASHVVAANQYIFCVGFPIGMQQQPTGTVSGALNVFENITGLEFQPAGATYDVLVGMDIIARGVLTLDFQGHWSFSF